MSMPNLRRIKVSSEQEFGVWLAKHADQEQSVMLVTHTKLNHAKFVSSEQVLDAIVEHGWIAGRRHTLNGNLLGDAIKKPID